MIKLSAEKAGFMWRETAYDTQNDLMAVAVRKKDMPWIFYDCAANRWVSREIKASPGYDVSCGLMFDSVRGLLLAVNANSDVFALRLAK